MASFCENESLFYSRLGEVNETIGNMLVFERFTEFWARIRKGSGQVQVCHEVRGRKKNWSSTRVNGI